MMFLQLIMALRFEKKSCGNESHKVYLNLNLSDIVQSWRYNWCSAKASG